MRFINLLSPSLANHEQQRVQRLLAAEKRIRHGATGPPDWEEVSTSAAMSRFHFLRRLQRTFGTTPHQLLIRSRLERAKLLLRETCEELKAKGVEFLQPPTERPYGIEALLKDNSGNWFSLTQAK